MSTALQTENTAAEAAFTRLERVRRLGTHDGFVWFMAKLKKLETEAMEAVLSKISTDEERRVALTRLWLLRDDIGRIIPDELKLASKAAEKAANQPPTTKP